MSNRSFPCVHCRRVRMSNYYVPGETTEGRKMMKMVRILRLLQFFGIPTGMDARAYYDRGCAKKMARDLDGAIADCTEAIRLDPKDATAYNNRGFAKYEKGDLDGAIADYTEAARLMIIDVIGEMKGEN